MQDEEVHEAVGFPLKCGSYEIERYLIGDQNFTRGCWLDGQSIYGDVNFKERKWPTISRPVFAYLAYVDTRLIQGTGNQTMEVTAAQGHHLWFFKGTAKDCSVAPAIDQVNAFSNLQTGMNSEQAWAPARPQKQSLLVPGGETYLVYQVALVYAHRAFGAADTIGSLFSSNHTCVTRTEGRKDLLFLSSVTTNRLCARELDREVEQPLSRDDLFKLILLDKYSAAVNAGAWSFDMDALNDPRKRY
ncbi:monalysin family beta-barrel pore-forming toxin [Pseudomonas donghuensis]|uniref:monalysin family beta-barrel pore-forming toxin n=1 Tax=Pseudomonas donghuensis TaxID=1163398 RepID=UPI00215F0FA5|nr:monalysin family beta-barrel pore-forming toxin [Pseudomonas donghuensis]UVL25380.1 monalysin family beta-barrel pore-forming toxin [Pseudomonas donghuensis]